MLPDLPEISLNIKKQESSSDKDLPTLPNYEEEVKPITIVEVKDDPYDESSIMEKSGYNNSREIRLPSPPVRQIQSSSPLNKNYIKKGNEVFVKIKKFESAVSSFNDINEKITEMQKDLERAKRFIQDETKELEEWEKELTQMKKSLDIIDNNLFSEIER